MSTEGTLVEERPTYNKAEKGPIQYIALNQTPSQAFRIVNPWTERQYARTFNIFFHWVVPPSRMAHTHGRLVEGTIRLAARDHVLASGKIGASLAGDAYKCLYLCAIFTFHSPNIKTQYCCSRFEMTLSNAGRSLQDVEATSNVECRWLKRLFCARG